MIHKTPERIRQHASRGGQANVRLFLIEGEQVTTTDIVNRTGKKMTTLRGHFAKLRSEPGAITWARLSA